MPSYKGSGPRMRGIRPHKRRSAYWLIPLVVFATALDAKPAWAEDDRGKVRQCENQIVDPKDWATDPRSAMSGTEDASRTWIDLRVESKDHAGMLMYIGARHVTSPDPALFAHIEDVFKDINPSVAFVETANLDFMDRLPATKEEAIQHWGEPRYLGFVAAHAGAPVRSLEPKPEDLQKHLLELFPKDRVALLFVLRDAQAMRDRYRAFGEALENSVSSYLSEQQNLWAKLDTPYPIRNIYDLTVKVQHYWPGLSWRDVPAEWFDPLKSPEQTGSIFVNDVVRQESIYRNHNMYAVLANAMRDGGRVVAIVGKTHVEVQQFALRCAAERK